MTGEKYINNQWAELWIQDKVLHIKYKPNVVSDLECGRKVLEDRLALQDGQVYPIHGDCRTVKYWTKECREFQSQKENFHLVSAGTVLYTESHVANVIFNFYLRLFKPPIPTKFCSNEREAIEWLKKYV